LKFNLIYNRSRYEEVIRYLDIRIIIIIEKKDYKYINVEDQLSAEDWRILTEILPYFKFFYIFTVCAKAKSMMCVIVVYSI
jgi:hypothetical protein